MKYRILFKATFNNIDSVYSAVYNLKLKCSCGHVHEKRVNVVDPKIDQDGAKNLNLRNPTVKTGSNKKLAQKIQKQHFNLIVKCHSCQGDMKIKVRDIVKRKEILSEKKLENKKMTKRHKRKESFKIKWVPVDEKNNVIQEKIEKIEELTGKKKAKESAHPDIPDEIIKKIGLDKKSTSHKSEHIEENMIPKDFNETKENESEPEQNENIKCVPVMPLLRNSFILAILETRDCSLIDDIKTEVNVLTPTLLFEGVNLEEGCWQEGDCSIVEAETAYEKV